MDPASSAPVPAGRTSPPPVAVPNAQAGPSRAPFSFPAFNGLALPPGRRQSGGGGGADDDAQAQFQARMLAQAQALAASGAQQPQQPFAQAPGGQSMPPGQLAGGLGQPSGQPTNVDWGAVASQLGNNMDREALIKQNHAQRTKTAAFGQGSAAGSPVNPTAPSPAAATAPSPAPSAIAPSPAPSATLGAASTPLPDQSTQLPPQIPPQLRNGQSAARPPSAPAPGGFAPGAMPVRPVIPNKQQFLQSLVHMYKMANQPPPAEIFNGQVDGAFQLGGVWIDLLELFIAASKQGGLYKALGQQLDQHAFWSTYTAARLVPSPLPEPVPLPRRPGTDPSLPAQMTTDPAQYLAVAYIAWISWLENMLMKQKMAMAQRAAQAQAGAAGSPVLAGSPAAGAPAMRPPSAPSPMTQPPFLAPTPEATVHAATPIPATPVAQASTPAASAPTSTAPGPPPRGHVATPTVTAPTPAGLTPAPAMNPPLYTSAPATTPIPRLDMAAASPASVDGSVATPTIATPTATPAEKKRKRGRPPNSAKLAAAGDGGTGPSTPTTASTPVMPDGLPHTPASARAGTPAASTPAAPAEPKRKRFKVEYKPLHLPQPAMAGWDERRVMASFPKYDPRPRMRSYHDLQIVDIEAVLMGMRSRMPREVAYALTALSMLSMPLPEDRVGALNINGLQEVYVELLELMAEAAFGDDGYQAWARERAALGDAGEAQIDSDLLERIARDSDYSLDQPHAIDPAMRGPRDRTGGKTDTVLTGLNIIRNFSLLADNRPMMARPELFALLATVTDARLARLPSIADASPTLPYSVLELARVRRDAVAILANLGDAFDLRAVPRPHVASVLGLLSSYLVPAWAGARAREPGYGPQLTLSEAPPHASLSVDRALEALSRVSCHDLNREAIAAAAPADELVGLFGALVRLLPLDRREMDAVHTVEDYLGRTELVALALYSLAFLAPPPTRARMRAVPGAVPCLTRLIFDKATYMPDSHANPFAILVRRLAETMGVLNGTATPGGNARPMGFGAGGVDGKGWAYANDVVVPGWMADRTPEVLEAMGWGKRAPGRADKPARVDGPLFAELDKLWWGV